MVSFSFESLTERRAQTGSMFTTIGGPRLTILLELQSLRHEDFNAPFCVPGVVSVDKLLGCMITAGLDLDLVVGREVTLACNVGEEVRDVAKVWLLRTDVAVKRNVDRVQFRGHGKRGLTAGYCQWIAAGVNTAR